MLEDFATLPDPILDGSPGGAAERPAASLAGLRRQVGVRGEVTLVVPPHVTLIKMIKAPPAGTGRRDEIVRFEAGQGIPGDPTGIVSGHVDAGARGGGPEVMLAAAKLDHLDWLCRVADAADLAPHCVLPAPVATLAAFRAVHPGCPHAILLFDLGIRSATLLLVEPRGFFARVLPVGPNNLRDETQGFTDGGTVAGSGHAGGAAASGRQTFVDRLHQETARTLLHLSRQAAAAEAGKVFVTGWGATVPGLAQSLGHRLNLPIERLAVGQVIQIGPAAVRNGAAGENAMLHDLVGAACLRLQSTCTEFNLLPPQRRREWRTRRRQPWLVGTGILVVLTLLPPLILSRAMATEAARKAAAIERALAPVRVRDARLRGARQDLEHAEAQLSALQAARDRRGSWRDFLVDLQDRLGRVGDVWLDSLQVVPATGAGPQKMRLAGRMLDREHGPGQIGSEPLARVKALIAGLLESPFIRAVEDERFDGARAGVLRFELVLVADSRRPL
ncbi:MAG TPA: hypothetical protein VHD61_07510 [Lacunisphaera sp.]|nr:hypothetical protein [Lacunisphaera sp.]